MAEGKDQQESAPKRSTKKAVKTDSPVAPSPRPRLLVGASPEDRVQFERHGYFVADLHDHNARHPVFNRAVTLRDSWTHKS